MNDFEVRFACGHAGRISELGKACKQCAAAREAELIAALKEARTDFCRISLGEANSMTSRHWLGATAREGAEKIDKVLK